MNEGVVDKNRLALGFRPGPRVDSLKPALNRRAAGIFCHITSLPGPWGAGDLGPGTAYFLDFLKKAGQRWWQMLPVVPPGAGDSPYSSPSAFAGNELFISIERLADEGLLGRKAPTGVSPGRTDYAAARDLKRPLLKAAFGRYVKTVPASERGRMELFERENAFWLDDYALYAVCKEHFDQKPWMFWEAGLAHRDGAALARARRKFAQEISFQKFLQYLVDRHWRAFRSQAAAHGVGLIGDIPFYVAQDSADVWAQREIFRLSGDGRPQAVAGVPPDAFSDDGQLWGNPIFDWPVLTARRYDWWIQRLKRAAAQFDALRLDHFIGFQNYWEIPCGATTAKGGRWVAGPQDDFFREVFKQMPDIELIAEDLGVLTPEVEALRDRFNLPGMRVLQFAIEEAMSQGSTGFLPGRKRSVIYTGTHDNDTAAGWWRKKMLPVAGREPEGRVLAQIFPEGAAEAHWDLIKMAFSLQADTAIIPIQDVLGLDSSARMNTPGTAEGNWTWRLEGRELTAELAGRLLDLTRASGRCGSAVDRFHE